MAPILCLLRSMAERGIEREAAYYYGARTEPDLSSSTSSRSWPSGCPLPLRPRAVRAPRRRLGRRGGLITDVVERLEEDLTEVDAYVCGPPPMVEAAIAR